MALTKSDIKVIYIAIRLLETALPYPDEVDETLDTCKAKLTSEEILELDEEIDELITSEGIKEFAARVLGK
ncbi:MAG: hypothetical protein WCX65_03470 [bacterium]